METYEEIYQRMRSKYIEESGCEFDEASDIAIRLRVLAGEIYNSLVSQNWLKLQMFSDTASGEFLDKIANQRGLVRREALKSQGEIAFMISEPVDHNIIIPKGTVVATDDLDPIRFVTTEDGEISAGNTIVSLYAEAEIAGVSGNVMANRVVIAVSVPAEIENVTNSYLFDGGEDKESDIELRKRIQDSYVNRNNGTNKSYYKQLALSVDGVAKVGVIAKARGNGTVNIYVCGSKGGVSDDVVARLQSIVSKQRELNVDVMVYKASFVPYDLNVNITPKSGYDEDEVKQKCEDAFRVFINSLDVGAKLYLSALGKCLLETNCVENYEFDTYMQSKQLSDSQCFSVGSIGITVE